jgi:hypothetical protein
MTPHPDFDRHHNNEPVPDDLARLLDAWQPAPELSAGFEANLRRRIDAAEAPARWWSLAQLRLAGAMAVLALLVGVGVFFARNGRPAATPAPAPVTVATTAAQGPQMAQNEVPALSGDALTRDLQTLNTDQDLLNHLDFLAAPAPQAAPVPQERD